MFALVVLSDLSVRPGDSGVPASLWILAAGMLSAAAELLEASSSTSVEISSSFSAARSRAFFSDWKRRVGLTDWRVKGRILRILVGLGRAGSLD